MVASAPHTRRIARSSGERTEKDRLIRRLALAKLRELREAGWSYREIGLFFRLGSEIGKAKIGSDLAFRIPPEQLLARVSPPNGAMGDQVAFLQALDALDQGLVFFDCRGTLLHANRAFAALLQVSPEGDQLRMEVHHFADSLCGLIEIRGLEQQATVEELAVREVPTEQQRYRLKGSFIGLDLFGRGPTTLIALERPTPDPLSDEALRGRFSLSKKESQVLRLLIEGNTNEEIAKALFVSPHTVRHHTEHIFSKLRVRSRAEVAARVLRG